MNIERTADGFGEDCRRAAAEAVCSSSDQASSAQAWIDTIQMYRFPLGLAVVAVHTGEFVLSQSGTQLSSGVDAGFGVWLVHFLTLISRVATPAFLVIAGFVFFRGGQVCFEEYLRKVKSRFYTLLVPYLAWNFLTVLLLCAPAAFKHLFFAPDSYTYTPLTFAALAKWIIGWPIYPADAPLWFIRDLLLLILMAPLLNWVPQRAQILGLGAIFLYWLLGPVDLVPGGIPRAASVLFFLAGAWMGINRITMRASPAVNRITIIAAAAFFLSAAAGATCGTLGGDHLAAQSVLDKIVRLSGALLVVCAGTQLSFPAWLSGPLLRLSPAAFFLFAFHYCVFSFLTGLLGKFSVLRLGGGHEVLMFALVFLTVGAVSLTAYFLLSRHAPSLLSLLDGNRSVRGPRVHREQAPEVVSPFPIGARRMPSPGFLRGEA